MKPTFIALLTLCLYLPLAGANAEKYGTPLWTFYGSGRVGSSPAIASDGTVYIGGGRKVFALHGRTGAKKWAFETEGEVYSSPAIGSDGTIYVGSWDKKIYALDAKSGVKKWEFATRDRIDASPSIGTDGTVYVGSVDKKLYALNGKTGVKIWEFETGGQVNTCPAIGTNGTVYVGSGDGNLYALNGKTGAKKWIFSTDRMLESSPSIGSNGTVYIGSGDKKVYAINGVTGDKRWEFKTGNYVRSSPTIGADGTVYVGSDDKKIYALHGKTGTKRWEFETGSFVGKSSPAIGEDGTIYVGSADGKLYALDGKTGTKKWEFSKRAPIGSSPAIGADGTVYFGSYGQAVFALKSESKGLAKSPWPMFGQNPHHTARANGDLIEDIQEQKTITNSLGMKFVSVRGVEVLFCIWETRVGDFKAFEKSTSFDATEGMLSLKNNNYGKFGHTWKDPGWRQTDNHPVVGVSWNDAKAFCKWLTEKERKELKIGLTDVYRLPNDAEWSSAVGKSHYAWGNNPVPPPKVGNYAGMEVVGKDWPEFFAVSKEYNDGFPRTSPVGSFPADNQGIYDLGGNVSELCEEWYRKGMTPAKYIIQGEQDDNGGKSLRLNRGDNFTSRTRYAFIQTRYGANPNQRAFFRGFRCVLETTKKD